MSGAQTSTFPTMNELLAPMAAYDTHANQLLQQQVTQQDISGHQIEMGARLASTLLDPTAYPTTEARAAAYPGLVARARAQFPGYFTNAPDTYPGDAATQALARLGTPSQTQQEWQANLAANKAYTNATNPPATAAAPATSGAAATVTPSGGATIGQRQNNPGNLTFAGQPGATPGQGNRFAAFPDMPTGVAANADQLALYQTQHGINTVRGAVTRWVGDPKADLGSYIGDISKALGVGPDDKIDLTNPDVQAKFIQAQFPHESAGGGFVLNPADVQKGVQMAAANRGRAVQAPGTQIAIAPPQGAPGGVATRTGGTDVAGPGAGPGGPATAPRVDSPGAPAAAGLKYNMNSQGAPAGTILGYLPNGTAVLAGPTDTHVGITGWNADGTPLRGGAPASVPQPQAQAVPQPPANRAMPGGADGPSVVAQQPPPPPAVSAPAGGPPPPQLPPLNARGLTAQQQAQIDAVSGTGRMTVQQRMAAEQAFVNQNIQLQQKAFSDWIQVQQLQTSQGQLSVSQQNSALEYWKALHPDAKITMTGGEIITQDPRNGQEIAPRIQVTPQRADTAAMAIVSRLGPKVANGTATPDEQAQYAVAVDSYRQPALRENPVTKETVRVNTRELPAGFPEPPGLGGTGSGGPASAGGSNVVIPGYSPQQQEIERNKGRYDIAADDLKHDRGEIAAIGDAGRSAQQDNLRVQEMRDILTNANTGPGTETAAHLRAWIARWTPGQLAAWDGSGANLSNPAAIEMFQKLGFVGAVTQERGSTPRGGYQATKMFQQFNPGAQLLTSTNQGLLAQRLIANQAEADYAQAAQDHYNTQRERLKSPEQNYDPLSSFDAKWQAQRNPQIYAAAIGALGGQDGEMWSRGLSKDEIQRVKGVVARADPKAVVNMPGDAPTGRNRPPLTSFQR